MRKVLIIDDHRPSRQSLTEALGDCGFTIVGEGTEGEGALQLAAATIQRTTLTPWSS
jgi:DNA-binding NarL/FixJ family response regulator